MKNQREIIRNVRSMSVHELLDLVVYNPFFLTDDYYVEIGWRYPERSTGPFAFFWIRKTSSYALGCYWRPRKSSQGKGRLKFFSTA